MTRAGIVTHIIGIGVGSPAGGKIGFADVSLTRELCCSDRPALLVRGWESEAGVCGGIH